MPRTTPSLGRLIRRFIIALTALTLIAVVTAAARAEDAAAGKGPLTGIDLMSSTVMQEGQSSFSGLAMRLRIHPSALIRQIEIMPAIEYWRNSSTLQPYDIKATRKDATLAFDTRYNFDASSWKPYLGVGFGIHFLSNRVDAPSFGLNDETDSLIKGGFAVLGGVAFPITQRIDNFLDLKYHMVSDYRQFKINWGIGIGL